MSKAEIPSPIDLDVLLAETDTKKILHGVVQRLLYTNPYEVRRYEAPTVVDTGLSGQPVQLRTQWLEYLAFIGTSQRNSRSSTGEGRVRLGYGYAFISEDMENEELNTGIIIPNPRIVDGKSGFTHDRNHTFREYSTSLVSPSYRPKDDQEMTDQVWRTDQFGGLEGEMLDAPLEPTLAHELGTTTGEPDDPLSETFKKEMLDLLQGAYQPVRPLTDRLHLYPI